MDIVRPVGGFSVMRLGAGEVRLVHADGRLDDAVAALYRRGRGDLWLVLDGLLADAGRLRPDTARALCAAGRLAVTRMEGGEAVAASVVPLMTAP